jgi:hypothetical protein
MTLSEKRQNLDVPGSQIVQNICSALAIRAVLLCELWTFRVRPFSTRLSLLPLSCELEVTGVSNSECTLCVGANLRELI